MQKCSCLEYFDHFLKKVTLCEPSHGSKMIERHLDAVNNNELFVSVEFNKIASS